MEWRLTSRGEFYDRDEGPVVYFHPETGRTHLLGREAARILQELLLKPCALRELAQIHIDQYDDMDLEQRVELVDDLLLELSSYDLVEPV